jgi:hypothetical protein
MTYQTDEKHFTIFPEFFVGVVKLACYALTTHLLLRVLSIISLNIYKIGHKKTLKMLRLRVFWATQTCTILHPTAPAFDLYILSSLWKIHTPYVYSC